MGVRTLRRFTDAGLGAVSVRLDQIDVGETNRVEDLLDDPHLTEVVGGGIDVEVRPLVDRMDAAVHLDPAITAARAVLPDVVRDRGLWTWLTIAWMEHLAPVEGGRRKLKERARWVLEAENWQRYYRHLLAGPYFIYDVHRDDPERVRALLLNPVNKPGEVVEQFASRQDLVRAKGVMGAVTALYVGNAGQFKRGAAGKDTPGSARRFADVLLQLDLTYDLQSLPMEAVLELLPQEFDRFKADARARVGVRSDAKRRAL